MVGQNRKFMNSTFIVSVNLGSSNWYTYLPLILIKLGMRISIHIYLEWFMLELLNWIYLYCIKPPVDNLIFNYEPILFIVTSKYMLKWNKN